MDDTALLRDPRRTREKRSIRLPLAAMARPVVVVATRGCPRVVGVNGTKAMPGEAARTTSPKEQTTTHVVRRLECEWENGFWFFMLLQ